MGCCICQSKDVFTSALKFGSSDKPISGPDVSSTWSDTFFALRFLERPDARHISGQAVLELLTSAMFNVSYHDLDDSTNSFNLKLKNTFIRQFTRPKPKLVIATVAFNATENARESPYLLTYERVNGNNGGYRVCIFVE